MNDQVLRDRAQRYWLITPREFEEIERKVTQLEAEVQRWKAYSEEKRQQVIDLRKECDDLRNGKIA